METNRGPRVLRPSDNGDSEDSSISRETIPRGDFTLPDDSPDSFPSNTPFLGAKSSHPSLTRRALSGVELNLLACCRSPDQSCGGERRSEGGGAGRGRGRVRLETHFENS
jgi:hypothetical protein